MIDSRTLFKKIDYDYMKLNKKIYFHILLTKIDKLSNIKKNKIINKINKNKTNVTFQIFSIKNKLYINKTKIKIKQWICL